MLAPALLTMPRGKVDRHGVPLVMANAEFATQLGSTPVAYVWRQLVVEHSITRILPRVGAIQGPNLRGNGRPERA